MSNEKKVEKGNKNFLSGLFRQQIFIPIAALIILAVFNLIVDPSFFKITLGYNSAGDPVLSGYLMTILDYGSELATSYASSYMIVRLCSMSAVFTTPSSTYSMLSYNVTKVIVSSMSIPEI